MSVISEVFPNLPLAHDAHGNAVGKAVLLVRTPFVKSQAREKRFMRLSDNFNTRIVENPADQPAC